MNTIESSLRDILNLNDDYIQERSPERDLIVAVLHKALTDCFLLNTIVQKDAIAYIKSDDEDAFSYIYICNILDIDYLRLRRIILSVIPKSNKKHKRLTKQYVANELRNMPLIYKKLSLSRNKRSK